MSLTDRMEDRDHAESLAEAAARSRVWTKVDPFPKLAPSLLSQVDIEDYVAKTGLIYPFQKGRLKTASYEGRLGKRAYRYDLDGGRKEIFRRDCPRGLLEVPANGIVFVESDLTFHLPLYIGLRFNLQILHVHRGLLLGTGPLIDPGFTGKILIPLHNLTSRPHFISWDEGLIWVEFTKTTYDFLRDTHKEVSFPEYKKDRDSEYWLNKAAKDKFSGKTIPIETAIPAAIESAKNSEKVSKRTEASLRKLGFLAAAGLVLAAGVFYDTYFRATYDKVDAVQRRLEESLRLQDRELNSIRSEMQSLKSQVNNSLMVAPPISTSP